MKKIITLSLIFLLILTGCNDKKKNKYTIEYTSNMSEYKIDISDDITVSGSEQVICIKAPCNPIKINHKINFSKENKKIVDEFIDNLFKDKENNIKLDSYDLDFIDKNIIESIVLNQEEKLNNKLYMITTNYRFLTMMDDGGSNTNIFYIIDSENKKITKYMDYYEGFKGYSYKNKVVYSINMDEELSNYYLKSLENLFIELFDKEDIKGNNYEPYVLKVNNNSKSIYNLESIESLKNILNKIDNLKENNID